MIYMFHDCWKFEITMPLLCHSYSFFLNRMESYVNNKLRNIDLKERQNSKEFVLLIDSTSFLWFGYIRELLD